MKISGSQSMKNWSASDKKDVAAAKNAFLSTSDKFSSRVNVSSANAEIMFQRRGDKVYRCHFGPDGQDFGEIRVK